MGRDEAGALLRIAGDPAVPPPGTVPPSLNRDSRGESQNVQRNAARATSLCSLTSFAPLTILRLAEMCSVKMYAPPADRAVAARLSAL